MMTDVGRVRRSVEYRRRDASGRIEDGRVVARKDEKKWEKEIIVVKRVDVVKSR